MNRPLQGEGSIILGGATYLVSIATDNSMLAFHNHLKKQVPAPMDALAKLMQGESWQALPDDVKTSLAKDLAGEAARAQLSAKGQAEFTEAVAAELMQSPANVAFLCWLLIRKNHPDITLEFLQSKITDENFVDVLETLSEESQLGKYLERRGQGRSPTSS